MIWLFTKLYFLNETGRLFEENLNELIFLVTDKTILKSN